MLRHRIVEMNCYYNLLITSNMQTSRNYVFVNFLVLTKQWSLGLLLSIDQKQGSRT